MDVVKYINNCMQSVLSSKIQDLNLLIYKKIFDSNSLLILIFLLAILLRIIGTYPGYLNHPDEPKIVDAALNITFHLGFEPVAFYYGSLLPIIYALLNFIVVLPTYIFLYLPINFILSLLQGKESLVGCIVDNSFSSCALQSYSKEFFLYLTRYETAFLSSFSVVLVYFLSKKLFSQKIGVLAAFLTSINYRHVQSSHFVLADGPLIVFIILSILLSLRLLQNKSLRNYIAAGVGVGLILSIKYFVYTIPVFIVCHILSSLQLKILKHKLQSLINIRAFISFFVAFSIFSIINLYIYFDFQNAKEQFDLNAMFYQTSDLSLQSLFQFLKIPLFPLYYLYKYGIGEYLSIAALLGVIISIYKYPKSTLILSAILLPFFYIFLVISGATYVRNYSAVIPLLLLFSAVSVFAILDRIKNRAIYFISATIIISVLSFSSLRNSFLVSYSLAQTQNQKLFLDWVVENVPNDGALAHTFGVPVPSYKPATTINFTPWPTSFMSIQELEEDNVQWVAVSSDATTFISEQLWTGNNAVGQRSVLDENFRNQLLTNNYANLLIQELSNYRVKEFIKPYWQSPDPSIFISKLPLLRKEEGKTLATYNFDSDIQSEEWIVSSILGETPHELIFSKNEGYANSPGLKISQKSLCPPYPIQYSLAFTTISSQSFPIFPGKWYFLSGYGHRTPLSKYAELRNGFIRLDFYSTGGDRLKTYVSRQLSSKGGWEKLSAFGMAPSSSSYAKVAFQLDYCNEGEKYLLDNIQVSESKITPVISLSDYLYYDKPLHNNFIWTPPL